MWGGWDWAGWIKPQIDAAVNMGANTIRLIGCVSGITNGTYTLAAYLARWQQFLDYTTSIGVMAYPCGGDFGHWGAATKASAVDIYRQWATLLAGYPNVIGVDITNEAFTQSKIITLGGITNLVDISAALAKVVLDGTPFPVAHSRSATSGDHWSTVDGRWLDVLADFIDIHAYYTVTQAHVATLDTVWWAAGRPLLLGEFGAGMNVPTAGRVDRYEAVRSLLTSEPRLAGALAWAVYDTGSTAANQLGLIEYPGSGAERADIAPVFRTLPTSRS